MVTAADLRKKYSYRVDGGSPPAAVGPAGWETWRKRRNKGNQSMLDDVTNDVKALRAQVKELTITVAKLEKANQGLVEKLNKTNQDVGNLRTDVKRKADK